MDIVKTGIGLSKTIKNAGRLREIITILAKNGIDELINISGLYSVIPNFVIPKSKKKLSSELKDASEKVMPQILGRRLAKSFEELGPSFIKLGQLLSSREDIFPEEFIEEMRYLKDRVAPISLNELRGGIEASLGKKIEDVFDDFEEEPIGTASIGIVFKAKLKTGEDVVVKVRRPDIERLVSTDFSLMIFIVTQLEKTSDEVKYLGISRILKDFSKTIVNEINFNIEALNCQKFRKVLEELDSHNIFRAPKIYTRFTKDDLLVMDYFDGKPFSKIKKGSEEVLEIEKELTIGLQVFLKSFLQKGFFHADLHGGNFFKLSDGKIGIIDFGLMGSLGKKGRQNFVAIVYSLLTNNYENLAYEFLDVADYESIPDIDVLIRDIRDSLSPFVGLTVQQTDYTYILQLVTKTLNHHKIFLPGEWFVVFRSLLTLDGLGKDLGIDFDIFSMMEGDIKEIISSSISTEDILEEGAWMAKDILSSVKILPRHIKWYAKEWAKRNYAFEILHTGHENSVDKLYAAIVFLGHCFMAGVFFVAGVFMLGPQAYSNISSISALTWVFWGVGLLFFIRSNWVLRIKKD